MVAVVVIIIIFYCYYFPARGAADAEINAPSVENT